MNLAVRDIRHNLGRFALTTVGIGLLLMIVMGMGGIYRGLIREGTLLVDQIGADFWVVQGSTRGPFAEVSRVPANLEDRIRAVPGVAEAHRFVSHTIQREHRGRPLRMVVQGLSWPEDKGEWIPLTAGRALRQLGLFRALLIVISTIIMALILYTLTLDKIHDIALLKLIGARNSVIVGLILQQALVMGALGYGMAWWLGQYAFPRFPRLVLIERPDLAMLAGIVLAISVLASLLGIWALCFRRRTSFPS